MATARVERRSLSVAVTVCMGAALLLGGSARAEEVKKVPSFRYVANGSPTITQTKGKVTVEATLISENAYDFPQIFAFDDGALEASGAKTKGSFDVNVWRWFPADVTKKHWVNVFSHPNAYPAVAAFWIKVRNETDHIINFSKDAKMFVQVTGMNEPAGPIKDLTAQLYPTIIAWEKDFEQTRRKGFLDVSYPIGFAATLFDWRFGRWQEQGFANKDVLPGFSAAGLMLFAAVIDPKTAEDVSLMLYEVPTETDAAGAVTARSRFTFRFEREPRVCWLDRETMRGKCGPADPAK